MLNQTTEERNAVETTVNISKETTMTPPIRLILVTPVPYIPTGPEPGTNNYLEMRMASADSDIYDGINEEADLDYERRVYESVDEKVLS